MLNDTLMDKNSMVDKLEAEKEFLEATIHQLTLGKELASRNYQNALLKLKTVTECHKQKELGLPE